MLEKISKGELDPVNEINCGVKVGSKEKGRVDYESINRRLGKQEKKGSCC